MICPSHPSTDLFESLRKIVGKGEGEEREKETGGERKRGEGRVKGRRGEGKHGRNIGHQK